MLKTIGALVFKLLASIGLGWMIRQGGKTSQKLDDAQDTIEGVEKRDEIERKHRNDDPGSAYERLRKRNR